MDREFRGIWIPAVLWLDNNFSTTEKIVLCEIDSYDKDFGCIASNKTLCKNLNIHSKTVSGIISSLEDKGAIKVSYKDMVTFSGRTIRVKYLPLLISRPPSRNQDPPLEKSEGGLEKSEPNSNTISNTISNSFPESSSGDKKQIDFNDFHISEIPAAKSDCMRFINSNTKKVFLEKYRKEMGTEFVFSDKESGKLRPLASKVLFKMKEKSDREFSVYELNAAITFFIHSSWLVGDNYIRSNFSLSIIDSKFNDLYVKIKDQSNGKKQTVRTAAQQIREEARKFARGE